MTETPAEYDTKGLQISRTTDKSIHPRDEDNEIAGPDTSGRDEVVELRQQAKAVLAITADLMGRLNERDIQLEQEEGIHNKTIAERDEARRWARFLYGRMIQHDSICCHCGWPYKVGRGAFRRRCENCGKTKTKFHSQQEHDLMPTVYEDDLPHYCGDCGTELQHVRPGKWQCLECS